MNDRYSKIFSEFSLHEYHYEKRGYIKSERESTSFPKLQAFIKILQKVI